MNTPLAPTSFRQEAAASRPTSAGAVLAPKHAEKLAEHLAKLQITAKRCGFSAQLAGKLAETVKLARREALQLACSHPSADLNLVEGRHSRETVDVCQLCGFVLARRVH